MIVTLGSEKGGAGKTTSAIHIAAYFQTLGPTLLLDDDDSRNAIKWSRKGNGKLTFRVAPNSQAAALVRDFQHVVIDTGQMPSDDDLEAVAQAGKNELYIIPAIPSPLDTDGLLETVNRLRKLKATRYRVLLTGVQPDSRKDADALREYLAELQVPIFATQIPRLKAFQRAAGEGTIVRDIADRNAQRAWSAYEAVGQEITA